MPFPLTPPPASDSGAFTIPRNLQRWLDVNPIGPLTRTQAYVTLPAFSQAVTWLGYSDIVIAFNYEGPNNFTLTGFNIEPFPAPNYCLCIMWKDQYGNVNRYSLWRGVGEVIYAQIPAYSGQKIAKNFRFEIWSTNSSPAVQATAINIYTSVLGGVDYRYGIDFSLISADAACTVFGVGTQGAVSFPTTGLLAHWRADAFNSPNWLDSVSGQNLTVQSGTITKISVAGVINGQPYLDLSAGILSSGGVNVINAPLTGPAFLFVIAAQSAASLINNNEFVRLLDAGAAEVASVATNIALGSYNLNTQLAIDNKATVFSTFRIFQIGQFNATIADIQNNKTIAGVFNPAESTANVVKVAVGATSPAYVAEIFFYSGFANQSDVNKFFLYLAQRYIGSNLFALPLVFPTNSSPTQNII